MQSRRDLVHAYKFSAGRLVAALTTGDTGQGRSPFRQSGLGLSFGITIGGLACGALVVFGLLRPAPSTAWRTQGAIVVQQETGTRFVYLDGALHPVANYASALLAAANTSGTGTSAVQFVPGSEIAGVPEGPEIGILGAPDTLPAPAMLLPSRWAVCMDPATPGGTVADLAPSGTSQVPQNDRVLVTSSAGEYVIWDDIKFPVPSKGTLAALGLGDADPAEVSAAWLDEVTPGPELTAAQVPDGGHPGAKVAGHQGVIGDLFVTSAGGVRQYYVLLADGLAPISQTESALRQAVPGVPAPIRITPADVAAAPASANGSLLTGIPDILGGSVFQPAGSALCILPGTGSGGGDELATAAAGTISQARLSAGAGVLVPSGAGMLAQASTASPAAAGLLPGTPPEYLITDSGEKFPIEGSNVAAVLGYGGVKAVVLPSPVLGLIPTGPGLSVTAATKAVPWPAS
jgi:type VII secretion protein EccB